MPAKKTTTATTKDTDTDTETEALPVKDDAGEVTGELAYAGQPSELAAELDPEKDPGTPDHLGSDQPYAGSPTA